jgi:hypothetical protein
MLPVPPYEYGAKKMSRRGPLCGCYIQWGSMEGIFGALFMTLSWHLACRGINTAKVRFSHISRTSFDHMNVNLSTRRRNNMAKPSGKRELFIPILLSTILTFHFFLVCTCHAVVLLLSLEVGNSFWVQVKASRIVRVQYLRKF